jgi:hypothetical protein
MDDSKRTDSVNKFTVLLCTKSMVVKNSPYQISICEKPQCSHHSGTDLYDTNVQFSHRFQLLPVRKYRFSWYPLLSTIYSQVSVTEGCLLLYCRTDILYKFKAVVILWCNKLRKRFFSDKVLQGDLTLFFPNIVNKTTICINFS